MILSGSACDSISLMKIRINILAGNMDNLIIKNSSKELDVGVQYLRGAAALFVVFFHLRTLIAEVIPGINLGNMLFGEGSAGVDVFFVISGYIIALSTQSTLNSSPIHFLIKRFFRIYPPFIACLIIYIAVKFYSGENLGLYEILRSALMLHSDYATEAPFFGYNILYPAWTLTYEVYFYMIFFISMLISHKNRIIITTTFMLMTLIGLQMHYKGEVSLKAYGITQYSSGIINLMASPMLCEFAAGMWLYKLRNSMPKGYAWIYIYICIIIFSLFAILSAVNAGHGINGYGVWAVCIVYCVVFLERCVQLPKSDFLFFMGEISYSLYLSHVIVISIVMDYFIIHGYTGFSALFMMLCLCIPFSIFLFNTVEKKSIKFGRILINS